MKKIVLIFVLTAGILQAKAQQKSNAGQLPGLSPNFKADTSWNRLFKLKTDSAVKNKPFSISNNVVSVSPDHMPVIKLASNDRMPVVQTDKTGYNMPVAGLNQPEVYTMKKPYITITPTP
jgi:hypothetical protein